MSRALALALVLAACERAAPAVATPPPTTATPPSRRAPDEVPGRATPVDPGAAPGAPAVPVDDPREGPVGRAPRRLDAGQLRASLLHATGATWTGDRRVRTNNDPSGYALRPATDLVRHYASALGEPDYGATTEPDLDPGPGFLRRAQSAAQGACRDGLRRDREVPAGARRLLRAVSDGDTYARAPEAVRANIVALGRTFWIRNLSPDGPEVEALLGVFRAVTEREGALPADGWFAVCVALATDPQFLLY
ncbi:MAG: hypothetical protein HY909_23275 [Deltaproteobacteria bacterium]|nr:hypothetical protein [Deltaproteobacteria bacterium]